MTAPALVKQSELKRMAAIRQRGESDALDQ